MRREPWIIYFRNQCVDSILLPKFSSGLADEAVTQMGHNTALVSDSSPRVFDLGFLRYCVRVFVGKITFFVSDFAPSDNVVVQP